MKEYVLELEGNEYIAAVLWDGEGNPMLHRLQRVEDVTSEKINRKVTVLIKKLYAIKHGYNNAEDLLGRRVLEANKVIHRLETIHKLGYGSIKSKSRANGLPMIRAALYIVYDIIDGGNIILPILNRDRTLGYYYKELYNNMSNDPVLRNWVRDVKDMIANIRGVDKCVYNFIEE